MIEKWTFYLTIAGMLITVIGMFLKFMTELTKFKTETNMKLAEMNKDICEQGKGFREHERMNEVQFEKYHQESQKSYKEIMALLWEVNNKIKN
jgi:hypothetical protein